jgi:hypothetical protein
LGKHEIALAEAAFKQDPFVGRPEPAQRECGHINYPTWPPSSGGFASIGAQCWEAENQAMRRLLLVSGLGMLAECAVTFCLNGCAAIGFYQMSDEWCMQHPEASPARCHGEPYDVVQLGPQTYQVSTIAALARGGIADAQHRATEAATEKCKSLGKTTTVTAHEFPAAGRAVVTFTCS